MLFLTRVEYVMNGQTHIGGWVENVTKGQTDEHTVTKNGDGRTDGRTNRKLFSKVGLGGSARARSSV